MLDAMLYPISKMGVTMHRDARSDLRALIARRPVVTTAELQASGVTRGILAAALRDGELSRQGYGVFATPEAERDPLLDDAVACLMTGGIICGRSAGMRHSLTDDLSNEREMLVPHETRSYTHRTHAIRLVRSRVPEAFTIGIEERLVQGIVLRMTNRPRTVVDLVVGPIRQHGVAAVQTFIAEGGTGEDLERVATPLNAWEQVEPLVEAFHQAMSRSVGR